MTITLKKARTIIKTALAKGREAGMKPLSVVVVDAGGHTIAFEREPGQEVQLVSSWCCYSSLSL